MEKHVLSVLVQNNPGALARISSLFGRRNFNIYSITAAITNDPMITRITMVVDGDEETLQQIIKQTQKLEETIEVYPLSQAKSLHRDLLLVKIGVGEDQRCKVIEICQVYEAKIVDLSVSSMIIELTGTPDKIDRFLLMIQHYTMMEMCRTGVTALERG